VVDADLRFHQQLVGLLGSPRIEGLYQNIQSELRLCLSITDRDAADPTLVAEHQELLELLVGGDRRRCRELLRAHLLEARELVMRAVANGTMGARAKEAGSRAYTEGSEQ
jgi:DNA-binding GntR family transcriptional regulator